jgi:hypothetical protein
MKASVDRFNLVLEVEHWDDLSVEQRRKAILKQPLMARGMKAVACRSVGTQSELEGEWKGTSE